MGDAVENTRKARYRQYLKAELEAAATYRAMAEAERDANTALHIKCR